MLFWSNFRPELNDCVFVLPYFKFLWFSFHGPDFAPVRITCQQTTFAYLDEGVEYVDTALDYVNVNKETRWLYHYSDSDVIEPIHCASRCWCLLEWQTARLADPRMRDTTWGCKLGQWQRLFHCLNYTLDEQVTWQLPPITLYIPTIWESPLSLFGL